MSLQDLLANYRTTTNMIVPNTIPPGTVRGSDNQPLFTSQYLMLQRLAGEPLDQSALSALLSCVGTDGYIHRAPGDTTPDEPDDLVGTLSCLAMLGIKANSPNIPITQPQPALLYLKLLTLSLPLRLLFSPLELVLAPITMLILALSNLSSQPSDTSNKLLTWCLVEATESRNPLFKLTNYFWKRRMINMYGSDYMGAIAKIYFQAGHPFIEYFSKFGN